MLSKNEVKYIQSLCQKSQREELGLFTAEGTKLADELLTSDFSIVKIYATAEWIALHPHARNVIMVTEAELARISNLKTPNQVLVIASQRVPAAEPVFKNRLTLVLDDIQDPGNFGTIVRIADWFGITQIIAGKGTVELYNPKVIQSTMGSFLRVSCWYRSLPEFLGETRIPVYGALLGGNSLYKEPPVSEGFLLIGNESKGISKTLLPLISHPVSIPRLGGAESLNAAVATGIILSHLLKN
jgi:TrmH family RNA methyltransferase